ncbi:SHIRT domain-containing protein [Dysosmobacter welbionis]
MKKRAISFVLCLMMVVTLFGNGIPVYAANELEPPIVATEETSQDAPEESEAEGSPAVEASEAAHGEDTNAAGETSSEVAGTSETDETTEDETTEATDAEETAWAEEGTENKPPEAADTEESATVNTPETTEEAVAEEKPDAATPSEADRAAEEPEVPAPANAMLDSPEVDGIPIDEEHFPGKLFREWLLGQRENDPANPNVFGSDDGILTEKERAAVKEIRFQYNINTGNPPPEGGLDLTGIEYFPNLETLVTQHIEITNQLDLSQNTKLKLISLDSVANITYALDLSNQGELEKLTLNGNNIPSLDLSNNPKLTFLGLHADITKEGEGKGLISELDLSNNPALKQIVIEGHQITSLDLSNNKKLTNITIRGNNLTSLDVSMLPELEYLYLESNELREIDVTKNPRLERLEISGNADISSLDISQNPELKELYAQQTSLFFLDAKNNRKLEILFLDQNPLLGYEIVDGGTSLPITYNRFLDVVTVRATPDGTVDLSQLVPELDGSRISKLTGADKIEGTTLYGVKNGMDVTYNYRTRTAGDGSSNGMLARIHIVSEEPAAGAHTVNYEFKNLPAYRSLPQRVKDLLPAPQTDVADGTVVTPPELAVTQVKDLSGIWHFQGWDKKTATVDGADVTFTGTWKLTQYKTFFASYNFVPSKASMDKGHTTLPQEVVDLIPDAMEGLTDGQVITHPTPAKTEVEVDGGKWVFAGWPVGNTATVQNGNIVTVAEWNFVEEPDKPTMKFTVTFKFVSLTNGTDGKPRELPQEVLDLLPAPITNLEAGTHVDCPTLAKTEIPAEGGKWVFTGWPAGTGITGITITGSALVVGGWRFDKESTPVEVAKRVQLNVHTLVDGKKNFATKDMLEQMNPVLRAEDGQEVKPVRIADNGFTFDFEQVPAGEYTLAFTYPAGYRFAPGKVGSDMFGDYLDTGAKVTVTAGYVVNNFYTRLEKTPDEPNPPVEVAKRVQLNVHTLVDGKKNFATKDMLEQMNPVLRAEDGQEVKPVRIADNGFTFDFEQVPAGEYTLAFTYPAGYRFAPGKVGSDMFGDYLDTGAKVTVTAGYVVNNFYTRLGKTPDEPNPPVNPPTEKTGNLAVTKTVSGSRGDQNKDFTFTVTLDKKDLNGKYGDMSFTGGVATFTLKHGQSKTANGLPAGVSYTVEESDNSGYTVTKTNATGPIQTGSTATASFENYKGSSGGSGGSGGSSGGDGGGSSSHTPQAARVTLTATKTMDGLIPTGSGFTFFLDDANGQRLQVKNNQGGNITFDTLTFNKTGTYVYYLTEQTGNDKNINYDTASYKVTVTVTCPYDYAASVSYEKNGQAYNSVPAFANTTKPSAPAPTPTQTPSVVAPARPLDKVPKTEDSSNLSLWGILAAASLLSLTVLLAGSKTRKARSQGKEHQS